jgi:hypothetical protein
VSMIVIKLNIYNIEIAMVILDYKVIDQ